MTGEKKDFGGCGIWGKGGGLLMLGHPCTSQHQSYERAPRRGDTTIEIERTQMCDNYPASSPRL